MSTAVSKAVRKVVGNEQEVAKQLCTLVEHLSNEAIEARGRFTLGLSGGYGADYRLRFGHLLM